MCSCPLTEGIQVLFIVKKKQKKTYVPTNHFIVSNVMIYTTCSYIITMYTSLLFPGEDDLVDIMGYLHTLDKSQLSHLGMVLGLSRHRVKGMKDSDCFLEDMISLWLQQADNVMTKSGVPTWRSLVKALRHDLLGQNGIASRIATEKYLE